MKAKPLAIVIIARVTTKGGIRKRVMKKPLKAPRNAPRSKPIMMPRGTPMLGEGGERMVKWAIVIPFFITPVQMTAAKATIEPTERSIPAVMMTKVIPTATIVLMEICLKTLRKLSIVRKFGAEMAK